MSVITRNIEQENGCDITSWLQYGVEMGMLDYDEDITDRVMNCLELAYKHGLQHLQTVCISHFQYFSTSQKKEFVAKNSERLRKLKINDLFQFIDEGLELGNKESEVFRTVFAEEGQPEESEVYEKKVNKLNDVTLLIGDEHFEVHKQYLAFWSPYFDRLFFGNFTEKDKDRIELKEIDPTEFAVLLKMIYPPRDTKIDDENVEFILKLADRFEMKEIMIMCGTYLANTVDKGTSTFHLMDLLDLSDSYNLIDVQVVCFKKISTMDSLTSKNFRLEHRARLENLSPQMINNLIQAI